MMKYFPLLLLLSLLSGCVQVENIKEGFTSVRELINPRIKKIRLTKQEIVTSKQTIASLQKSVAQHKTVLANNRKTYATISNWIKFSHVVYEKNGYYQCRKSSYRWRKKPKKACANSNEANKLSGAMCAASIGGPEACGALAGVVGKKRGVPMYNFLSSPACGATIAKLNNKQYSQEDFIGDFALGMFQDYLDNLQKQGNFLEAMIGNAIYYSLLLNKFDSCMRNARSSCSQLYTVWKEEDSFRKVRNGKNKLYAKCQSNLKQMSISTDNIQNAKTKMAPIHRKISVETKKLRGLEKQLQKLNRSRRR